MITGEVVTGMTLQQLMAMAEFEDSIQAEEYIALVGKLLAHPALASWAKATDDNFAAGTNEVLEAANEIFDDFYQLLVEAGE